MKSNFATIAKSILRRKVATFANSIIQILASVRSNTLNTLPILAKMSDRNAIIPLQQKEKRIKMNKYELRENAVTLAKENYGTDKYAVLWGAASVLLSESDLKIIISALEK
jgi:hypothetical protein